MADIESDTRTDDPGSLLAREIIERLSVDDVRDVRVARPVSDQYCGGEERGDP